MFKDNAAAEGSGRANSNLEDMIASLIRVDNAIERSWTFASCYASINVDRLVQLIDEMRSSLCDIAKYISKPGEF